MSALVVPVVLLCVLAAVMAFVVWLVFFSRSEKDATSDQHSRSRNRQTPA
jgi:hypothetical protein